MDERECLVQHFEANPANFPVKTEPGFLVARLPARSAGIDDVQPVDTGVRRSREG